MWLFGFGWYPILHKNLWGKKTQTLYAVSLVYLHLWISSSPNLHGRLSTLHSTFMSGFRCCVSPCASAPCTSAAPRTFVRSRTAMGISSRWKPILFTPRNTAWLVNKLDHLRILSHTTRCNCCPRLQSLVSKGSAVAAPSAVEEALHCPGCGWAGLAEPSGGAQREARISAADSRMEPAMKEMDRLEAIGKRIVYRVVKLLWRKKQFVAMFGL